MKIQATLLFLVLAAVPALGQIIETKPYVFSNTVVFSNTLDTTVRAQQKGTNYLLDGDFEVTLGLKAGSTVGSAVQTNDIPNWGQVLALAGGSTTWYLSPTTNLYGPALPVTNRTLLTSGTLTNWTVNFGAPTLDQYMTYFWASSNQIRSVAKGFLQAHIHMNRAGSGGFQLLVIKMEGYVFDTATGTKKEYAETAETNIIVTGAADYDFLAQIPYSTNLLSTEIFGIGIKCKGVNNITSFSIMGGSNNLSYIQLPKIAADIASVSVVELSCADISISTNWTKGSNVWLFTGCALTTPLTVTNYNNSAYAGGTARFDIVYWPATTHYDTAGTVAAADRILAPEGTNAATSYTIPAGNYFGMRFTNLVGSIYSWRNGERGSR